MGELGFFFWFLFVFGQARQLGYEYSLIEAQSRAISPSGDDDSMLIDFILSFGWWPPTYHYHRTLPRLFLPLFRADCQAINSYAYAFDDFAMECPILCFGSERDAVRCGRLDLEEWEQRTISTRGVEVVMVESSYGHNFWVGKRKEIVVCLRQRVGSYLEEFRKRQEKKGREAGEKEDGGSSGGGSSHGGDHEEEGGEELDGGSDEESSNLQGSNEESQETVT